MAADERFIPLWVERYVAALPPSHPLTLKERLRASPNAQRPTPWQGQKKVTR